MLTAQTDRKKMTIALVGGRSLDVLGVLAADVA